MFYRYSCPACEGDLKVHPPAEKKSPWYLFIYNKTMSCPHCRAEIQKRFAHFDGLLGMGLMVLLGSSGFIAIGRLTKYVIPLVGVLFALRWLAGGIFSVYVLKK